MRKQALSILVENTSGVLSHISGLFSRRGYNIDSFSSGVTADPRYTRITIVASGDEQILEQIEMANLLDVSVSQLLGIEESIYSNGDLAEELAELNEQLARKKQKEKLLYQANQKRGLILFVTFLSMMITMSVKNEVVSILLAGICTL